MSTARVGLTRLGHGEGFEFCSVPRRGSNLFWLGGFRKWRGVNHLRLRPWEGLNFLTVVTSPHGEGCRTFHVHTVSQYRACQTRWRCLSVNFSSPLRVKWTDIFTSLFLIPRSYERPCTGSNFQKSYKIYETSYKINHICCCFLSFFGRVDVEISKWKQTLKKRV